MAWIIEKVINGKYLIVENERKKSIWDSENKNLLVDWYDNITYVCDDYFIIRNANKEAIYQIGKGFISCWLDYSIVFKDYSEYFSELIKRNYLIAYKNVYKSKERAFFKLDGTQVTDWFYYISIRELDEEDIYYYAERDNWSEGSVFSLKSGKVINYSPKNEVFPDLFKGKFFIKKDWDKYLLINKNGEVILTADYISSILKDKTIHKEDVYIAMLNKRKKVLFCDGYLTKAYDFIFPVSPNLIFLAYNSVKKDKKVYLLDLKNKTTNFILFLLSSKSILHRNDMYLYINLNTIEKYFELPAYFYKKMEELCDYKYGSYEIYCPNCDNTWWLCVKHGNSCFCPLCEVNKLFAFLV